MDNLSFVHTGNWVNIVASLIIVLCFYFTLTFFQHLKEGDERLIKQSKAAAVICLALALLIPIIYNFYFVSKMMN